MPRSPYPGLRPFKPEEHDLLFGQERNLDELFLRLARQHFVAVLGESGCGKSSLVRAGLIPMLTADRDQATAVWKTVITQPGTSPIRNLAEALSRSCGGSAENSLEAELRSGPRGLFTIISQMACANNLSSAIWAPPQFGTLATGEKNSQETEAERSAAAILTPTEAETSIHVQNGEALEHRNKTFTLIVIDQFEELFRLRNEAGFRHIEEEAALYVKLLLNAARMDDSNAYILLTMRSEYLGEAAQFYDLAEAISDGLFLLPRMKRLQCEDAIVEPARSAGAVLKNSVVQRLLNETEAREDGLPLLQHALRYLWDNSVEIDGERHMAIPPDFKNGSSPFVYWCLNRHLDGILAGFAEPKQRIASECFKLLGEQDSKGRLVRHATPWSNIQVLGTSEKEILAVVNAFRDEECGQTFLLPSRQERECFEPGDKIDISHEVLLRQWRTYRSWLREEYDDSAQYLRLADAADQYAKKEGGLLQGRQLLSTDKWVQSFQPTPHWASRYTGDADEGLRRNRRDYVAAMKYLEESKEEDAREQQRKRDLEEADRRREIEKQRLKWIRRIAVIGAALLIAAFAWFVQHEKLTSTSQAVEDTTSYDEQLGIANQEGRTMDERVPSAIAAGLFAKQIESQEQSQKLIKRLSQRIPLNEWELFSAVRKGQPLRASGGTILKSCSVSIDSTGTYAAVANRKELSIWNLDHLGPPVKTFPMTGITCLRFSGDGHELLASIIHSDPDDVTSIAELRRFSYEGGSWKEANPAPTAKAHPELEIPSLISFSFVSAAKSQTSSNATIAWLSRGSIHVLAVSGKPSNSLNLRPAADLGAFSDDGRYLIAVSEDQSINIYKLDAGSPRLKPLSVSNPDSTGQAGIVTRVVFSKDASRIAVGFAGGRINLYDNPWSGRTGRLNGTVGELSGSISALTIEDTPDGTEQIAAGSDSLIAAVYQQRRRDRAVPSAINPDGRVKSVDPGYGAQTFNFQGSITWLSFAGKGDLIVAGSADRKARVLDIRSATEVERIPHRSLVVFASETAKGILSASQDGDLELTPPSPTLTQRTWIAPSCSPEASALSPEGDWAWACNGSIYMNDQNILDANANTESSTAVSSLAFGRKGQMLAWTTQTPAKDESSNDMRQLGIHVAHFNGKGWVAESPLSISAMPDSAVLATSNDDSVVAVSFLNANNGPSEIRVLNSSSGQTVWNTLPIGRSRVLSLAINSDGAIAAGTKDNSVLYFERLGAGWGPALRRLLDHPTPCPVTRNGVPQNIQSANQAPPPSNPTASAPQNTAIQVITALAFVNGQLFAARPDQSIWRFADPAKSDASLLCGVSSEGSDRFAFDREGRHLALYGKNSLTLFGINENNLEKLTSLRETGIIDAVRFHDGSYLTTSAKLSGLLAKSDHTFDVSAHEKMICVQQPWWSGDTISVCTKLGFLPVSK